LHLAMELVLRGSLVQGGGARRGAAGGGGAGAARIGVLEPQQRLQGVQRLQTLEPGQRGMQRLGPFESQ